MNIIKRIFIILVSLSCVACTACQDKSDIEIVDETVKYNTYVNPVFRPVLADPSVLYDNGYFYAYGTEDNWGNEGGHKLVPIVKSKDLVNWELIGNAFTSKPNWKSAGGIWAPDVAQVNGKFHMYYSFSTWGDPDPGIGLAIADTPQGPFIDQGKLFLSSEIGVHNSIDAFYIEDNGVKYLFWGSFHGIYGIELSEDGKSLKGEKWKIGDTHLEATYIYKRNDKYVYFGSMGSCCEGANSTYRIVVAVADDIKGPYLDKEGRNIAEGHYGELILSGNSVAYGFAGPGHNGHIMQDDEGNDWLLYHAIPKNNPFLQNGASRRPLMLDKIIWKDSYWPSIQGNEPSLSSIEAPIFK